MPIDTDVRKECLEEIKMNQPQTKQDGLQPDTAKETQPGSRDLNQAAQLEQDIRANKVLLENTRKMMKEMQQQGKPVTKMMIICKAMESTIASLEEELRQLQTK